MPPTKGPTIIYRARQTREVTSDRARYCDDAINYWGSFLHQSFLQIFDRSEGGGTKDEAIMFAEYQIFKSAPYHSAFCQFGISRQHGNHVQNTEE
jgi:hypothetical protein